MRPMNCYYGFNAYLLWIPMRRVAHGFSRGGHESRATDSSPPPLKGWATPARAVDDRAEDARAQDDGARPGGALENSPAIHRWGYVPPCNPVP